MGIEIQFTFIYTAVSCVFLCLVLIRPDSDKTVFLLKCYCVCAMPLSIEALIRSIVYVRNVWGHIDYCLVAFTIVSVLVLCLCALALSGKFSRFITREIYFRASLALAFMVCLFPFVSFVFTASLHIVSVWGCSAAALFALSQENVAARIRKLVLCVIFLFGMICCLGVNDPAWLDILGIALVLYAVYVLVGKTVSKTWQTFEIISMLALWILFCPLFFHYNFNPGILLLDQLQIHNIGHTISIYGESHPEIFSGQTVNILEKISNSGSHPRYVAYVRDLLKRYSPTGAVLVLQKKYVTFLQYSTEAFIYAERGVLPFFGLCGWKSLEYRKKVLAGDSRHFNSPDFDSKYDGIGDVFYRRIYRLEKQ